MRIFISIDVPKEVRKEIEKIQAKLPKFKGKKTEPENLHLTLKFLGEIDDRKVEEVKERLKEIKYGSFEAEIDSIGFFDNRKSSRYKQQIIIWLHMKNCKKLQKKIDDALKCLFKPEKRFMSHLTIARVKKISNKKFFLEKLKQIKISNLKFNINSFHLMQSKLFKKGPKYSVIEKYTPV